MIVKVHSDTCSYKVEVCDECGAGIDGCIVKGLWNLNCGHKLCSECKDVSNGKRTGQRIHDDKCLGWGIGKFPTEVM